MREHVIRPENTHTRPLSDRYSIKDVNSFSPPEKNNTASLNPNMQSTRGSGSSIQLKAKEEDRPLQGKFEGQLVSADRSNPIPIQRKYIGSNEEQAIQKKEIPRLPIQKKENKTGLPDTLKTGVEHLSGMDLSDVKVHHHSGKPSEVNALAYAQGNEIHLSSGEEKHLPHEAWHVVQQRQGRVKPTLQMKQGIQINDDQGLEREADQMGAKASRFDPQNSREKKEVSYEKNQVNRSPAIQRMVKESLLGSADKAKYQALVLKVQEHNKAFPTHTVQFDRINNQHVNTIKDLIQAVNAAIRKASEKAQEASKPSVDISQVDESSLVAYAPKKKVEAEVPKPIAKVPKAPVVLSENEKLEQSIMSSIGSGASKTVQREDFTFEISNNKIQTLVEGGKPANIAVAMGNHSKLTDNTIYFPISIVETISSTKTNTYHFEVHYHPDKTGNWLHPKRTPGSSPSAQIDATHWMIDLPKLQTARIAWNFCYGQTAPTLP